MAGLALTAKATRGLERRSTHHLRGRPSNERVCLAVREQVRAAVEVGLAHLLSEREHGSQRALLPRLAARLPRLSFVE
jgi:hypothetical protein